MKLKKRLLSLVAATALVTSGAMYAGIGAAQAAPNLGRLIIDPASGPSTNALTLQTGPGEVCPVDTAAIEIHMIGAGISTTDGLKYLLQGNTDISLMNGPNSNHATPVARKFSQIFGANSLTNVSGTYTVKMICIADDFTTVTGEFTQLVDFTATADPNVSNYVTQVPAQGTTTVLSGPTTSTFGDSVTLTANVDPDPTGGTIEFKEGATVLGSSAVNASGVATYTASNFPAGAHNITAVYSGVSGFSGSTSSVHTLTVAKVGSSATLTSNGPTAEFAQATFTATVTPALAGTVAFKEGATTLGSGSVNGSGVATFSTSSLSAGTHSVVAEFTPANPANVDGTTSNTVSHNVTAFAGVTAAQPITVDVPSGALTISIAGTVGNVVPVVDMGEAEFQADGQWLYADGELNDVIITDTRAGDSGWAATGVSTPFVNGSDSISAYNLGWDPNLVSAAANQDTLLVGAPVAGDKVVTGGTPAGLIGLGSARAFATTFDDHGNGTAILDGSIELWIPTDVQSGEYSATLTFTVI